MDVTISNYLKKPEEVKVLEWDGYPFRKSHLYIGELIPNRMVKNKCAYEIIYLDPSLFIKGFVITTVLKTNQILAINILGEHPNCDPNTNTYCWPEHKKGLLLNKDTLVMIQSNLKTYYIDSAYFIPESKDVEYKKLNSISIQLNKGDP